LCVLAAVELLIGHGFWLASEEFVWRFVEELDVAADGMSRAFVDWEAAAEAVESGGLACSDADGQVLRIAASIAEDVRVGLRDVVSGLGEASAVLVAGAILRAGGSLHTLTVAGDDTGEGVRW
jgi:hypothetical protein